MQYDLTIRQGATFNPLLKYSQSQFAVKAITGITKSGQAVVTSPAHGLTLDWPVWIVGAGGMEQINHRAQALQAASKAYYAYFVDGNTLRLNVDTTRFALYTSGGDLMYHPPFSLSGYTARMQIRESLEDTVIIHSLTTENGGITLGGTAGTIALLISATATAAFTFSAGVYDLEIVSPTGVVTRLLEGSVTLSKEVTHV